MTQDIFKKILSQSQNSNDIFLLNTNYTYGQFFKKTSQYSTFLEKKFIKNSILGICMNYSEKLVSLIFACYLNKIKFTIINPNASDQEKKYIIENGKLSSVFFSGNLIKVKNYKNFDQINYSNIKLKKHNNIVNNDICIIYTSGTSGLPKGVVLTINSLSNNVNSISKNLKLKKNDKGIIFSPPSYAMAISQILLFMNSKLPIIFHPSGMRFPLEIFRLIKKYKISILNISVSAYNVFREFIKKRKLLSVRLVMSGGMELSYSNLNDYKSNFPNAKFINFYGCTENSPRISHYKINENKILKNKNIFFSVGKPLEGVKIKIQKKNPLDKNGLIFISGKSLMRCYLDEKPKKKYKWYNTGDLGFFDKNKNLFLMGRNDNIFRVGHEKLSPEEVELILKKYLKFKNPIVSKTLDPILGLAPILILQKNEKKISLENLRVKLIKYLSNYKIPKKIIYINKIPKNNYGKIDRKQLVKTVN